MSHEDEPKIVLFGKSEPFTDEERQGLGIGPQPEMIHGRAHLSPKTQGERVDVSGLSERQREDVLKYVAAVKEFNSTEKFWYAENVDKEILSPIVLANMSLQLEAGSFEITLGKIRNLIKTARKLHALSPAKPPEDVQGALEVAMKKLIEEAQWSRKELEKHAAPVEYDCDILNDGSKAYLKNDAWKQCESLDEAIRQARAALINAGVK